MVDSIVDNWSMRTQIRAEIKLELSVKTPVNKIEDLIAAIKNILNTHNNVILSYSVFLKDISKNGATIITEYFTRSVAMAEFDSLKQTINIRVKKLLEEEEIEFAGEASRIVIDKETKDN